jgi:hypothetical protein
MRLNAEEILAEWKSDSQIDETRLGLELTKTPILHSKYLDIYMQIRGKTINAENKFNKLKYLRKRYYRGEMTREELQQQGWDQYQGLKMNHTEFNQMTEIDPLLSEEYTKVQHWKILVQGLEYIMKQVQQRDWSVKTLIEHNKLMLGM